jgi:hypothetical protein
MTIVPYPATTALSDLPPLPSSLFALLLPYLRPLLTWLSDQYCARMLQEERAHLLVQIARYYDLTPVVEQYAAYYSSKVLRLVHPRNVNRFHKLMVYTKHVSVSRYQFLWVE